MNRRPCHLNVLSTVLMLLFLILTAATTMIGCGSDSIEAAGGGTEVGNPKTFAAFADDDAMAGYLKTAYAENVLPATVYEAEGASAGPEAEAPVVTPDGASDYYSQPDAAADHDIAPPIVLADDPFLYVAVNGTVIIVRAAPADGMTAPGALTVPGRVQALYKHQNILAAVYTPEDGEGTAREERQETGGARIGTPYWIPAGVRTGVLLADVADPSAPRPVRRVQFDGLLTASRRYDGALVLATQFVPELPGLTFQYEGDGTGPADIVEGNLQALADVAADDLLPHYQAWDGDGAPVVSGRLVEPQSLYRPTAAAGGSIVALLTFRLDATDAPFNRVGLAADIHGIHMAPDAVYLAGVRWQGDGAAGSSPYATDIFRMTVAAGHPFPDAAGGVAGRLVDSLAMGEDAGVLRIASALTEADAGVPEVAVSLLTADGNRLTTVGSLTQPSQDAPIDAARFDGPLGYIFTTNGPVSVLDLSAPAASRSIGAVPSGARLASIRRLDDRHLLTVSRADEGADGALAIWELDAAAGPVLLHEEPLTVQDGGAPLVAAGGAYDPVEGLLALPTSDGATSAPALNDVRIFRVDLQTGFTDLGAVQSPVDAANVGARIGARPVFINETLYIATADGVRAAGNWDALSAMGTIWFNTL